MATLTDAQRKLIIQKGLNPVTFEKMDQAKVDRYFPITAAPAPAPVAAPVPVVAPVIAPAPAPKPTPAPAAVKAPVSPPIVSPLPAPTVAPAPAPAPKQATPTGPYYAYEAPKTDDFVLGGKVVPVPEEVPYSPMKPQSERDFQYFKRRFQGEPDYGKTVEQMQKEDYEKGRYSTATPFASVPGEVTEVVTSFMGKQPFGEEGYKLLRYPIGATGATYNTNLPNETVMMTEEDKLAPTPLSELFKVSSPYYAFEKPKAEDVTRQVKTGPSLVELANRYVSSRATTPEGKIDPELEKAARAKADAILGTKFTSGGEAAPITAPFVSESADQTSILEALKPQRLATPEQLNAKRDNDFDTLMNAISQLHNEYLEDSSRDPSVADKIESLYTKPFSNPDLLVRVREIDYYKNVANQALAEGKQPPPFEVNYKDKSSFDKLKAASEQVVGDIAGKLFTSEEAGAGIVETPLGYVGRLLGAPVSAGIGAIKALGPDTLGPSIAKGIREGAGVMGAGVDVADAAIEASGLPKDSGVASASRALGGGAGLIVDFLLPVVPGLGSAQAAAKAAGQTVALGKLLPKTYKAVTTKELLKNAAKNAAKAAAGEAGRAVPFASRYISPEYGNDIYSQTIYKFGNDSMNNLNMAHALRLSQMIEDDLGSLKTFDKMTDVQKEGVLLTISDQISGGARDPYLVLSSIEQIVGDLKDIKTHKQLRNMYTDMVKRAILEEALDPKTKESLANQALMTSNEALKDLITYFSKADPTGVASGLKLKMRTGLTKAVQDLSVEELLDLAAKNTLGFTDIGGFSDALTKQYLYDFVNRKLTLGLMSDPKLATLLPKYTRLTRTSFVPQDKVNKVFEAVEKSPIAKLRDKLSRAEEGLVFKSLQFDAAKLYPDDPVKAKMWLNEKLSEATFGMTDRPPLPEKVIRYISEGKNVVGLSKDEVKALVDLIGPASLRSDLTDNTFALYDFLKEAIGGVEEGSALELWRPVDGLAFLDAKLWNVLTEKVIDALAAREPGYKSVFDVQKDLSSIKEGATFTKETYYQKVLTPKEVAGGTLETAVKAGVNKALDQADASNNILSKEFSEAVGQKWGSISEDFKMKYRDARSRGKSAPDAWSEVIVTNYLEEAEPIIDRLSKETYLSEYSFPGMFKDKSAQVDKIIESNYTQMFDDYVAMLFGGYESVIDAYNTTGRTQFIDKMLVPPFEMRKLAFVLSQHPMLQELKTSFLALTKEGKHGEALVKLRDAHALLQGRGIKAFIPDFQTLDQLFTKAKANDINKVLGGLPFSTNGYQQGTRGIKEIWNYAGEAAPMFLVDNHLELLAAQYQTRRMAGMVNQVYQDWANIMPSLFPTAANIDQKVQQFKTLMESYLLGDTNVAEEIRAVLQERYPEYSFDVVGGQQQFVAGKITPFSVINSEDQAYDIVRMTYDTLLEDDKLLRAMYVAGVEDALTNLSSTSSGVRYSEVVSKFIDDTSNKALARIYNTGAASIEDIEMLKKVTMELIEEVTLGVGKKYIDSFLGVDDYVKAIYPKLRQETTPLFFDTLKTAIRQAANSNIGVITRGPLEQVATIPLTFGDTAAIKKQLLSKANIEQFTETMDQLAVSSTVRKFEDQTLLPTIQENINKGLEEFAKLRAESAAQQGYKGNRAMQILADVVGSPSAFFSDGKMAKVAKGGVLGGNLLPNFRYLMTNYLTAPAIIYGSIGKITTPFIIFDAQVNSVVRAMTGGGVAGIVDVRVAPSPTKVEVLFQAANGKIYTNYDIAEMMASNSISRSQASAELTNQVLNDIVSFSGVEAKKITGDIPAGLNSIKANDMAQFLKNNTGYGNRAMNIYQEIGNTTDTMFRAKVLIDALKEGRSEMDAITLAREALFDYGNLSSVEKQSINKIFWFWTFRRNSYRQVLKSFLTNPTRMKNAFQANGYFTEIDREYNISTRDYANTRPFIHLVNDKENKQRYSVVGPAIPQLDAVSSMIDHLSMGMPLLNDSLTMGEKISGVLSSGGMKLGEMSNPLVQTGIGLYFGVDVRREGKELGYGIDPRMMAWLISNPEVWNTFQSLVNVEVVPPEDEIPGKGTYQGRQWRIRRGDTASVRNWFAIQQALLGVGIQRNLRDYASVLAPKPEGEVIPVQMGGAKEEGRDLQNWLYFMGVITPIEQPPLQDQIEFNKRALAEKFREGTYK